ncbi:MAG: hypothetical protein JXQ91_20325 [Vannielia sp.]|uniref:sensor histidine kinase n=1 Tax=Vannielia sp. TaxID=2813045 RepID=UPI003B8EA936
MARISLMLVGTAAGTLFLDLHFLPWWLAAYYGAVALEKGVLAMWPAASSRSFFTLLVGLNALVATAYAALPTYLWLLPDPATKFGAMVLMVGGVLNVFLVRARLWQISAAYMVPLGVAFLVIAAGSWEGVHGGFLFHTSLVLAILIILYFLVAVYEANLAHRKLLETERQFFQAQKMEAIGTLAGGLSHDFNNLLSVVQGNLELMQLSDDKAARDACATEALTACWRGAALTRQLMALGRGSVVEPQPIDAAEALYAAERLVRRVLPESIGLTATTEPGLPPVLADETNLQAAILNLAINARDAMPDGGALLFEAHRLTPTEQRPDFLHHSDYVALSVSDNGAGIPREMITKVFDPFFSTKPEGSGNGLGLAMVDGFARSCGGRAHAESLPGKGSRFTLYLPTQEPAPAMALAAASQLPIPTAEQVPPEAAQQAAV